MSRTAKLAQAIRLSLLQALNISSLSFVGDSNTANGSSTTGAGLTAGVTVISRDAAGVISITYASVISGTNVPVIGERVYLLNTNDSTFEVPGTVLTSSTTAITYQTAVTGAAGSTTAATFCALSRTNIHAVTVTGYVAYVMPLIYPIQLVGNYGQGADVAGTGSTGMRAACTLAAADASSAVVYMGGTNNLHGAAQSGATAFALAQADIDEIRASGKHVFCCAVYPTTTGVAGSAASNARIIDFNTLLQAYCAATPNLHYVDTNAPLLLSGTTTGEGDTAKIGDGLHTNTIGAQAVAEVVAAAISPYAGTQKWLPTVAADAVWPDSVTRAMDFTSWDGATAGHFNGPALPGTGSSLTALTGGTGLTGSHTLTASALGYWQEYSLTNPTGATIALFFETWPTGAAGRNPTITQLGSSIGQDIYAYCEWEVTSISGGVGNVSITTSNYSNTANVTGGVFASVVYAPRSFVHICGPSPATTAGASTNILNSISIPAGVSVNVRFRRRGYLRIKP